ncbi:hypothetical protein AYK24_06595 [Thermoplasmatales archaeon SG8-52-4]|nr:MAG: hypothetical protein AYK24_06595 [Thermoplasmatales archaeon SG8-52-4]
MAKQDEIFEESMKFVRDNKGLKMTAKSQTYASPRVSSEFMDCSMPCTFDHFSHCSLGCTYCFAYMFKTNNPSFNAKLHSVNPKKLVSALSGNPVESRGRIYHKHFYHKRFLLHWGGLADPFCNFEKTNGIGYEICKGLARLKYPTLFSFKGSGIFRPQFMKLFEKSAKHKNFAFQISLVTADDKLGRQVEIGVPVPSKRIKAIKLLSDMGYYTILRLRPFIIGITDHSLDELLERCLEAGISAVSLEFFALDMRSNEGLMRRYRWLQKLIGTKDIMSYFKDLSPSERGGYMRLNRLVKEQFVKKIYKFCLKHDLILGISDPDFKELNMSGSCCGMPDDYPDNPELENWTTNQLTYWLKEARREYHKKGRILKLHFDKVFLPDEDTYLLDHTLAQDHVSVTNKTASERRKFTYLEAARTCWNNIKSPGNPRNYFHGQLMPSLLDNEGNLVYKYSPSEYEDRWAKEGIDLTR